MIMEMPLKDALVRFPRLAHLLPLAEIDLSLPYVFRLSFDKAAGKTCMEVGLLMTSGFVGSCRSSSAAETI